MWIPLLIVAVATFFLNIPFGYWRQGVRKFSLAWFLAVHLPIPMIVLMRLKAEIGFVWYSYPIMIAAYFGGQLVGARLRRRRLAAGA